MSGSLEARYHSVRSAALSVTGFWSEWAQWERLRQARTAANRRNKAVTSNERKGVFMAAAFQ